MCIITWGEFASIALVTETKREKAKERNNKEKATESCHYFKQEDEERRIVCDEEEGYEARGEK